jgi:hypothetical protein
MNPPLGANLGDIFRESSREQSVSLLVCSWEETWKFSTVLWSGLHNQFVTCPIAWSQ